MPDSINHERRRFIGAAAATLGAARLGIIGSTLQQLAWAALTEKDEGPLPSLSGATQWLNSPPLTPAGLRGKVVLVDFWTYTCVNWLRTLPYVRAWADKYRDQGLVVIGAHTPEFPFEKDVDNVRWAAKEMDVRYPIAVDSDYGVWRAFDNNYWPAVYIADANGRIVYRSHARDVNLIMGPPPGAQPVRFTVKVDGKPPGAAHGTDVDDRGNGTAARQKTYQLVREQKSITDREFEIKFAEPGVKAFCFTFGKR